MPAWRRWWPIAGCHFSRSNGPDGDGVWPGRGALRAAMQKPGVVEGIMKLAKCVTSAFAIPLMVFCGASMSLAQQETSREVKALALDPQTEIRFTAPWTPSAVRYSNAQELVVMGRTEPTAEVKGPEQLTQFPVARALITIEPRRSPADAQGRLEAIAASRGEPAEFIEIGGWPAVEVKFGERLPRR